MLNLSIRFLALALVAQVCLAGDKLSLSNEQCAKLSQAKHNTKGFSLVVKCTHYLAMLRKITDSGHLNDSDLLMQAVDSLEQRSPSWNAVISDLKSCFEEVKNWYSPNYADSNQYEVKSLRNELNDAKRQIGELRAELEAERQSLAECRLKLDPNQVGKQSSSRGATYEDKLAMMEESLRLASAKQREMDEIASDLREHLRAAARKSHD